MKMTDLKKRLPDYALKLMFMSRVLTLMKLINIIASWKWNVKKLRAIKVCD